MWRIFLKFFYHEFENLRILCNKKEFSRMVCRKRRNFTLANTKWPAISSPIPFNSYHNEIIL